jgi:hypothetical protein
MQIDVKFVFDIIIIIIIIIILRNPKQLFSASHKIRWIIWEFIFSNTVKSIKFKQLFCIGRPKN